MKFLFCIIFAFGACTQSLFSDSRLVSESNQQQYPVCSDFVLKQTNSLLESHAQYSLCSDLFLKQTNPQFESRAGAIAEKIWGLDNTLGLTKLELINACLFIERISHSSMKKHAYSKEKTGLRCKISKESGLGYLISDLPQGYISSGCHKTVSKAILYGDKPRILAACLSDKSGKGEVTILRKLRNCRGIVACVGTAPWSHDKTMIWLDSYLEGSLLDRVNSRYRFTEEQILKIAKDLSHGLLAMHRHRLVHRDLHLANMLLRKASNGLFDAALIDFGQSMPPWWAGKRIPQAPRSKNPPEVLIVPIRKLNRYAADVYALGANFYSIVWNSSVPWGRSINPYVTKYYSHAKRRKIYRKAVARYDEMRKKLVGDFEHNAQLHPYQRFQLLIFRMLDYNPARRPSMKTVVRTLDQIDL